MIPNKLKAIWAEGKPTINGWCSIGNPFTAEIMAAQGFDSVTIDMQHGALDYSNLLPMFQAMRASGATLMARVPWNEPGIIMKALDAGAYGITMASNYNGRYRPAEVMIHQGKDYLVRQREDMEYILQNQVQSVNFETNGQIESEINELDPALRADGKLYRELAPNDSI